MRVRKVAISILLIVIFIGILFLISLYMYDNSKFSKITGYSFFTLWTDNKIKTTYKIVRKLEKVKSDYKILLNIALPSEDKKIDAVLVHESGVVVIGVKDFDGWIYGREQDILWGQALNKDKVNKFNNPLIENKLSILKLKDILPDLNKEAFHSLIVFTDRCSFNKIEIHSQNVDVLKISELNDYLKNEKDKKLSKEEVNKIYSVLEKYMDFKEVGKPSSINNIKAN